MGAAGGILSTAPPEKVLDDVLDEYVSVEAARDRYGVVLKGKLENLSLKIDKAATTRLRKKMRSAARAGARKATTADANAS